MRSSDAPRALWLAPMRGVTIRTFRRVFGGVLAEAGFAGTVAPFIPANPGLRPNRRLLSDLSGEGERVPLVPQVIGKDPVSLRTLLAAFREHGFTQADLNAGCPFPMIRNKGRGSGLLRTPDVLDRMLEAGCAEMGPGNFSVKVRLGVMQTDELLALMPVLNRYPLARVTVHARTAKQMYGGTADLAAFRAVAAASANPVVYNGDADATGVPPGDVGTVAGVMTGRAFVRALGARADAAERLDEYLRASAAELCGDAPVLGRMKELLAYWAEGDATWARRWRIVKRCRSVDELRAACGL